MGRRVRAVAVAVGYVTFLAVACGLGGEDTAVQAARWMRRRNAAVTRRG